MAEKQKPEWETVEIAQKVMRMKEKSELDLAECKKMAARIMRDEGLSPEPNSTDPKPAAKERPSRGSELLKKVTGQK